MWFGLAMLSALFQVLRNMSMKHLGRSLDDTITVWGRFSFLLPFAAIFVLWHGIPPLKPGFWLYVMLFGVAQTIATLSLARALRLSQISMVTALWKVGLLFLVLIAFLSLGERPSGLGLVGIVVSLAGVYVLNIQKSRVSLWAPVRELFVEPGLRYTLLAAAFYAPSVVLIKQVIIRSDAYFANLMAYLAASLLILPLACWRSPQHFVQIAHHWPSFIGMGLFACLASVCHGLAFQLTLTSYVEAAKQAEVLFALGIGYRVFHEQATVWAILPGSVVILLGMVLLHLSG